MKRSRLLFIFIFLMLSFIGKVSAFELCVGYLEENWGGCTIGENEAFYIAENKKVSLQVSYGEFWKDNENLSKIEISTSGIGNMNPYTDGSELVSGDTISGSGNNYTITVNSTGEGHNGYGSIVLTMPSVSSLTIFSVSFTAKSYDNNNSLIDTKTMNAKFAVIPNQRNCDNSYNYSVTTSAGIPDLLSELIGKNYAISTDNSTIDITITPESNKSEIYYDKNCSWGTEELTKQNSITGFNLDYGDENAACFIIYSECFTEWQNFSSQLANYSANIFGELDWYENLKGSGELINIIITRNDNRSKVNTLRTLSISDVSINFNPDLKNYIATVPYKVSSVKINSTLTDSKSSYVSGYGNRTVNLDEGSNDIYIKVKAENGDETTYTIKITREKNDDASLKSLTINDKKIKLENEILLYNEYVNNDVTKAEIKAEATDSNAKVEIEEISELKEGINKVSITVTAASGKKSIYVVNIIRDKLISENSKLKALTIKNHKLNFNSNVYEYTIDLAKNEDKLDIVVETDHQKAKYLIIGNKGLKNGSIVKIKVTAEDGKTTSIYELKINKENDLSLIYVLIPVVVVLLIVFIVYKIIMIIKTKPTKSLPVEDQEEQIDDFEDIPVKPELSKDNNIEESSDEDKVEEPEEESSSKEEETPKEEQIDDFEDIPVKPELSKDNNIEESSDEDKVEETKEESVSEEKEETEPIFMELPENDDHPVEEIEEHVEPQEELISTPSNDIEETPVVPHEDNDDSRNEDLAKEIFAIANNAKYDDIPEEENNNTKEEDNNKKNENVLNIPKPNDFWNKHNK